MSWFMCIISGGAFTLIGMVFGNLAFQKAQSIAGASFDSIYQSIKKPSWAPSSSNFILIVTLALIALFLSASVLPEKHMWDMSHGFFDVLSKLAGFSYSGSIFSGMLIANLVIISIANMISWVVYYYSGFVVQSSQWQIWTGTAFIGISAIIAWLTGRVIAGTLLSVGFLGFTYVLLLQKSIASLNPDQVYVVNTGGN